MLSPAPHSTLRLTLRPKWERWINLCLDQPCLVCGDLSKIQAGLCETCDYSLPWQPPGCQRCGVSPDERPPTQWTCDLCDADEPDFRRCHSLFRYAPPLNTLIGRLKDRAGFAEARTLGSLLAREFERHYRDSAQPLPALLAPVPLHPERLRLRGYNQSHLLAQAVSARTGVKVLSNSCQRRSQAHSQRGLDASTRRANTAGMFAVSARSRLTSGRQVAIIDDVVTTTSTIRAMARVLRHAGAGPIDVWALARAN